MSLSSTSEELRKHSVATSLTKHTNQTSETYSLAALRRLCDDKDIQVELTRAKYCDYQNIERCRETASAVCHLALCEEARLQIVENEMLDHVLQLVISRMMSRLPNLLLGLLQT